MRSRCLAWQKPVGPTPSSWRCGPPAQRMGSGRCCLMHPPPSQLIHAGHVCAQVRKTVEREVRVLRAVGHVNIVALLDVFKVRELLIAWGVCVRRWVCASCLYDMPLLHTPHTVYFPQ